MRHPALRMLLPAIGYMCLVAAAGHAAPVTLRYVAEFDSDEVVLGELDGYDTARMPGALTTVQVALPELPLRLVRFALPQGTVATEARAEIISQRELPGTFRLRPRQPEVPLSHPEVFEWAEPDARIYSLSTPYPPEACRLMDNGNASGHRVATVAVYPLQYIPADGTLLVNERVEITLVLAQAGAPPRMAAARRSGARELLARRVRSMVVNPEGVHETGAGGPDARDDLIEYLIITTATHAPIYEPLKEWRTSTGVPTDILTTDWIYSNYDGRDNQEQIRNCIIDYYENRGTIWVLLGGDTNVVPARIAWAMRSGVGSPGEDDLRCDLYFSDLDGTWNADGDDVWGEVNQDSVDMYADIFVGRAPTGTTTEATRFVQKVLTYEGAPSGEPLPGDYQLKMLFLAEVLWSTPWTDGGICKNMIDDESVPPRFDPITKLYQTNGLLTKQNTLSELNSGHNIVNHNGHANYNVMSIGGSALYNSDFDNLTNSGRYGTWYTIGCWAAAIDYNCIAEHWVTSPGGGGVAFVGNSRYGWGSPGNPGGGTSDLYDREFFRKLFNDDLDELGVVHAGHKDEFVSLAKMNGYYRYCLYELNLLGDPVTRVYKDEPLEPAVAHPTQMPLGEHPFVVAVGRDSAPVEGARICIVNEELYTVGTTGPGGHVTLFPAPTATGSAVITVTGQGVLPYIGEVAIVDGPPDTFPPHKIETLALGDPFGLGGVIELDWTGYEAPDDFAYYKVYRENESFDDVSNLTPIHTGLVDPALTHWDDTSVVDGEIYYYAMTAIDLSGNEDPVVFASGPIASTNNARIFVWDADDGDTPFNGIGDEYTPEDGTEVPWVEALDSIGELYTLSESLPADLSGFDLIIYLGGVVDFGGEQNVRMTDEDAVALTDYIDAGGSIYVEEPNFGGPYYVNGSAATIALWNRFHATFEMGAPRATGNVEHTSGLSGTVTEGTAFQYDYQDLPDQFVGKIAPTGEPETYLLWEDQGAQPRGSLYVDPQTGSRRFMVPILLGGLTEGTHPSTRLELVTRVFEDLDLIGTSGTGDEMPVCGSALKQNVPNPFNPMTTIAYTVARDGSHVSLAVYNVAGRLVAEIENAISDAGTYSAVWDGRDGTGAPVTSGIYFYRLSVDDWTDMRKMVLLK